MHLPVFFCCSLGFSNLSCYLFWAGKRGRRSSAGSLDSNLEVSRLQLTARRPHQLSCVPLLFLFTLLSLADAC